MVTTKPSARARTVAFAILMPAAIAVTDQLLFEQLRTHPRLSSWLYPWLVFTTAVLSWSIGRNLSPPALRWLVFGWSLLLLDLLTIAACLSGPVSPEFGYVLVSAQVSLLTLWAILAAVPWQWRLPAALLALAAIVIFSGSFMHWWNARAWNALMMLTAPIVATLFIILRYRGFRLRTQTSAAVETAPGSGLRQFGTKHILVWASAIVPLLLLLRRVDLSWLEVLVAGGAFFAVLLATSIAILDLIAIGAILGSGNRPFRIVALFCAPPAFAVLFRMCPKYWQPTFLTSLRPQFIYFLFETRDDWIMWFVLNTAMLAALLLFLRGQGYRLTRSP